MKSARLIFFIEVKGVFWAGKNYLIAIKIKLYYQIHSIALAENRKSKFIHIEIDDLWLEWFIGDLSKY